MSRTLERIRELVIRREAQILDHGYDELADDDLFVDDLQGGLAAAVVVEDSPDYHQRSLCACAATGWTRSARSCGMGETKGSDPFVLCIA